MERVDMLFEPVRALLLEVGAFLPRLGVAVALDAVAGAPGETDAR